METLSQTENRELMTQARESLRGNWGLAIGTLVVYYIICHRHELHTDSWLSGVADHFRSFYSRMDYVYIVSITRAKSKAVTDI